LNIVTEGQKTVFVKAEAKAETKLVKTLKEVDNAPAGLAAFSKDMINL
jgi:hypothetical protein